MKRARQSKLASGERRAVALIHALLEHGATVATDDEGGPAVVFGSDGRRLMLVPDALTRELVGQGLLRRGATGLVANETARAWYRRKTASIDPFRWQHSGIATGHGPHAPMVDLDESPLAWLARRKGRAGQAYLDAAQFAAGERLRLMVDRARLGPRVTASWDPSATPGGRAHVPSDFADATLAARDHVNAALAAVGPDLSGVVFDVCGHLKGLEVVEAERGWPKGSARVVLGLGLSKLAVHFGLSTMARGPERSVTRAVRALDARGTFDAHAGA